MGYLPVRVHVPDGTPLLTRLRVAWAALRLLVRLNRASEAEREQIFVYLGAQPGVILTRTEKES